MANQDGDLEQMTTVFTQLLARIADNAPEAVAHVMDGMSPEQRQQAEQAISTGRWNNRRG